MSMRTTVRPRTRQAVTALACALAVSTIASWTVQADSLPFDRSNPFIWDNDAEGDAFTLPFVLALANNGDLNLVGISQSPHPFKNASEDFQEVVRAARSSGWKNIPDATWDLGPYFMTALAAPRTGRIEDTLPLNTAPARMIRDRVLALTARSKPVVIGTGGALTTVASAYLLALREGRGNEFARKVIVAPAIGTVGLMPFGLDYNASQDEWALYVVLTRLRVVVAPLDMSMSAEDQQRMWQIIESFPDTPMGAYLRRVRASFPYDPTGWAVAGDMQPILAMLHPQEGQYFHRTERVMFDSWSEWPSHYPDHGPADPAHPERPALNWNAFKAIANLKTNATAATLMLQDYDQRVIAAQFVTTMQLAGGVSAPGQ